MNNIDVEIVKSKRKTKTNLNHNIDLLKKFETIIETINNIIESLHNELDSDNKEYNSEQLSNLFKILRLFAKDIDNIEKMAEYVLYTFL